MYLTNIYYAPTLTKRNFGWKEDRRLPDGHVVANVKGLPDVLTGWSRQTIVKNKTG